LLLWFSINLVYSCVFSICSVFFFFFQAEDGIRDLTVTGVQTCALPICSNRSAVHVDRMCIVLDIATHHCLEGNMAKKAKKAKARSEERRVGKECRSRWSA